MQTRLLAAAVLSTTALGGACALEPGACLESADCAFGQACNVDGRCEIAGAVAGPRPLPMPTETDTSSIGSFVRAFTATGRFEGTIGGAEVEAAQVSVNVHSRGVVARFSKPDAPSTFLLVQSIDGLDPGVRTVVTDPYGEVVQACNYDSASYDEWFPSYDVEVSPPREASPEDQIIAEDRVETVVDVTLGVSGDGSDVTVTFAMPVSE